MYKSVMILAAVGFLGFAGSAHAQFYLGVHGGANFVQDSDLEDPLVADAEARFDTGFALGGVGGYRFGVNDSLSVDVEGEVTYRDNALDEFDIAGADFDASGDVYSLALMANAWVNWEIGDSGFAPYLGGGLGAVIVDIDDPEIAGIALEDGDDTVFGGQVGAGLGYSVTEHVVVSLDYRFLITEDPDFDGTDAEYQNHTVLLGVRYLF